MPPEKLPAAVRRMLGLHDDIISGRRAFTPRQAAALEVRGATVYLEGALVGSESAAFYEEFFPSVRVVSPVSVRSALAESDAAEVTLVINSPGGNVATSVAIRDEIVARKSEGTKFTTVASGMCCSAATYVHAQGDRRLVSPLTDYMIHNCATCMYGDAAAFARIAEFLAKADEEYAARMAEISGMAADDVRAAMAAETWWTSDEVVKHGFADALYEPDAPPPDPEMSAEKRRQFIRDQARRLVLT